MRLIDAERLEKQAVCIYTYGGTRFVSVDTIKKAPTIEAEPVKHGRWVYVDGKGTHAEYECNQCCIHVCFDEKIDGTIPEYKRCPNCGCKMDLEGEG